MKWQPSSVKKINWCIFHMKRFRSLWSGGWGRCNLKEFYKVLHLGKKKELVRIVRQYIVSYSYFTGKFLPKMKIQTTKLFWSLTLRQGCSIFPNNWSRSGVDCVKRKQQMHKMSAYSSSGIIQLCRCLHMSNLLKKTWCTHLTCFGI